jgi:hypothetical protein
MSRIANAADDTENEVGKGLIVHASATRTAAFLSRLAHKLYDTMEHLDPTPDAPPGWENLSSRDQDFYKLCIEAVFEEAFRDLE